MLNQMQLIGRLGKDVEIKMLPSGNPVANFSVATSFKFKKGNEAHEKTEWHNVKCFGQLAENCSKFLAKGSQTYVSGRLETSSWEKDGAKHYRTEIIADRVVFLDSKKESQNGESADKNYPIQSDDSFVDPEIPF